METNTVISPDEIEIPVGHTYLKDLYPLAQHVQSVHPFCNNFMSTPITIEELISSLNNCKNNKAPGPDEISYEFLKFLPDIWLLYLLSFYNNILDKQKIPHNWAKINIKMIFKKGGKKTLTTTDQYL